MAIENQRDRHSLHYLMDVLENLDSDHLYRGLHFFPDVLNQPDIETLYYDIENKALCKAGVYGRTILVHDLSRDDMRSAGDIKNALKRDSVKILSRLGKLNQEHYGLHRFSDLVVEGGLLPADLEDEDLLDVLKVLVTYQSYHSLTQGNKIERVRSFLSHPDTVARVPDLQDTIDRAVEKLLEDRDVRFVSADSTPEIVVKLSTLLPPLKYVQEAVKLLSDNSLDSYELREGISSFALTLDKGFPGVDFKPLLSQDDRVKIDRLFERASTQSLGEGQANKIFGLFDRLSESKFFIRLEGHNWSTYDKFTRFLSRTAESGCRYYVNPILDSDGDLGLADLSLADIERAVEKRDIEIYMPKIVGDVIKLLKPSSPLLDLIKWVDPKPNCLTGCFLERL